MANRYWVGGTANWDATAGSKWALTSGGTGGEAVPTSADDVFFDANSGAVTVTKTSFSSCKNLDFSGFTGTFAGSSTISIFGSLVLDNSMTRTFTGALLFSATSSVTLTFDGVSLASSLTFDGVGGTWTLQDALVTTAGLFLSKGTFNANNFAVTASHLGASGTDTRVLTMGSGTWSLTAGTTSTIWNTSGTGLTLNANTSTIKFTGARTTAGTFEGGGLTFNNFWNNTTGDFPIIISSSNTFNDFKIDAGRTQKFTDGTTTTVTTFTATGTSGSVITIDSTTTATHALVKTGGGTISCDYLNIQHSVATPSLTWYAGANSTDNQAAATIGSGWIFTVPPPSPEAGSIAFASDGRKNGEGAGAGTGVMVFYDGTAWRACDTGATVAA